MYIVDAFTDKQFGGNPAGVVILDIDEMFPSDTFMQKLSAELGYSETAFVKLAFDDTFLIRYFTPVKEVELCGHATIASFSVLREESIIINNHTYFAETLAGKISISVDDNIIFMDMCEPQELLKFDDINECAELYNAFGLDISNMPKNLMPEIISTGLPDIMLPINDSELLNNAIPNFENIIKISRKYNVVGIHAFSICHDNKNDVTAFCRNFAPLYGIEEESATGTSNGALTYYLKKHNIIRDNIINSFVQGEVMGRPSIIKTLIYKKNDKDIIRVGGNSVIILKGNLVI